MKLTTLNLQGFHDWQNRKPEILKYLKETDPDIILFQEVVFIPEISYYNQVQLLNTELEYPYEHSSITRLQVGLEYPVYREGLAMLSKYPVTKSDTIILKQEKGDEHNRIVQLIDIRVGERIVKFANIHFSITDFTDFATAHLVETVEIIKDRKEQRIIAGDFNIDFLEDFSTIWGDDYVASTKIPYISYPSMNKRNDYVLLPKPDDFTSLSLSNDALSDHRALTVEFNI